MRSQVQRRGRVEAVKSYEDLVGGPCPSATRSPVLLLSRNDAYPVLSKSSSRLKSTATVRHIPIDVNSCAPLPEFRKALGDHALLNRTGSGLAQALLPDCVDLLGRIASQTSAILGRRPRYPDSWQPAYLVMPGNMEVRIKSSSRHFDPLIFGPASVHVKPMLLGYPPPARPSPAAWNPLSLWPLRSKCRFMTMPI